MEFLNILQSLYSINSSSFIARLHDSPLIVSLVIYYVAATELKVNISKLVIPDLNLFNTHE